MNTVIFTLCVVLVVLGSTLAFQPARSVKGGIVSARLFMARGERPVIDPNETEDELMARMRKRARKMMFNENGVAYAPWVAKQIDEDAIVLDLIRKEKEAANPSKKSSVLERGEIQSSEGMKWRMQNNQVDLAWVTGTEADNKGFIVEKRPSYGGDFQEIATYEEVAGLRSAGVRGGKYRYLDPSTSGGSWIYRIKDCDSTGEKDVLCQCFVEVQTDQESNQQTAVLVGLVGILAAAAAAGSFLDPTFN